MCWAQNMALLSQYMTTLGDSDCVCVFYEGSTMCHCYCSLSRRAAAISLGGEGIDPYDDLRLPRHPWHT